MLKRVFLITLLAATQLCGMSQVNIWEDTPHHKKVKMYPFIVSGSNNPSVIVCPGGSYFWHDIDSEGFDVAHWLNSNGISAFVLRYRTAYVPAFITHYRYIFRGNRYPDPQDDLRQTLRFVRSHHQEYGIDPSKIGVMGFSAGGHLVMSAATLFPPSEYPAFIVPVYPVVTMSEPCVHKRSRRALLGDNKKDNLRLRDSLSLERHIPADCPPVFLVNCKDDPIVHYHNSELLDSALSANNVPHTYIQYKTGGHGFGATPTKGTAESRQWMDRFLQWFHEIIH